MKLSELEPEFFRYESLPINRIGTEVSLAQAQALTFLCPKCKRHQIEVTFHNRGVPNHHGTLSPEGRPSRWDASGTGYEDLTLTPSIHLQCSCDWHGFIKDGLITPA